MTAPDWRTALAHRLHPDDDKCDNCGHAWHGLVCRSTACGCATAWRHPDEETAA